MLIRLFFTKNCLNIHIKFCIFLQNHLVDTVYQITDVIIPLMCAILLNYEDFDGRCHILLKDVNPALTWID
jgi:hypothetical protein